MKIAEYSRIAYRPYFVRVGLFWSDERFCQGQMKERVPIPCYMVLRESMNTINIYVYAI